MALNFGVLQTATPVSAFFKGQEDVAQNVLAQQKAAQEQETNALRRQQMQIEMEGARLGQERTRALMAATEEDRARARRLERTGMYRERLLRAPTPEAAREVVKMQYADPDLAPVLSQFSTLEQALAEVPDDPTQFQTYRQQEVMGMSEWMKSQLPKTVGNAIFDPATRTFITPPVAPKPSALLSPEEEAQKIRIAQASRPPAQPREPAAPTITQIQDPTNPSQMITIDARRYQGGGVGSPGVIGTTGKSAPAAAAAQKQEQGASQAQDILDNLRFAYEDLNRQKAIPSTQRNVLSNTLASIGASGVGQVAGRVVGTEAQTQRDIIASARNQLFAAVKNATGLSAQNLNSNVEFTTWLNSLTDPAKSIEANREILSNMEKFIASGGKYSAKKGAEPAAGAQARPAGVGPDWTLMTDKNGNRAWVSPDRKSFKEVK